MKHNATLLCLLLAMNVFFFSTAKAQVNTTDSLALVDLYNSTNGPNWSRNASWLTTAPLNTWYGIKITDNRVTSISLLSNGLQGTIPSSIGNLANLEHLNIPANYLSGKIPAVLGALTNLTYLDLSLNELKGTIPTTIFNLENLTYLNLSFNQLSGTIHSNIGNLVNLQSLDLGGNQFQGTIPSNISKLVNLTWLNVEFNKLSGPIPIAVTRLSNLTFLDLGSNGFSGTIPPAIGRLVNLTYLALRGNGLSGSVPASFRNLVNLDYLFLEDNQLTQEANVDFPYFPKQKITVGLYYNRFTFDGLEFVAKKFPRAYYFAEARRPVHQQGNTLSVYAGGTLSNNTYNWFKVGTTGSTTITGDSTFTPPSSGKYYVTVTNAVATKLTLYSDTIDFTMNNLTVNSHTATDVNNNKIKQGLLVYPSPASNIIHIQTSGIADIVLTNSTGKILFAKSIKNRGEINISAFANGIYYIQNKTTGESEKIIIVH